MREEDRATSIHGKKGFVTLTKSFVKIGITKIFCYTTKCLVLSTKRLISAGKFLVAATKILSVVPNFDAVTKLFVPCTNISQYGDNPFFKNSGVASKLASYCWGRGGNQQ